MTHPHLDLDWEEIHHRLRTAATTATKALMVEHLLSGLRKQVAFLPPGETVLELVTIAVAMADPGYTPCPHCPRHGEAPPTSSPSQP